MTLAQDNRSKKLNSKLQELELLEKERQTKEQAKNIGIGYINLDKFPISHDALKIIAKEQAEALQTLCFLYTGSEMRLASLNPNNPQIANLVKELGEEYHARVQTYLISDHSFQVAFDVYEKIPSVIQIEGVSISAEDLSKFDEKLSAFSELNKLISETNVTDTINLIIAASLKFGSSDIHIEAEKDSIKIRMRIDGVLHETANIAKENWEKMNSRLKLLSGLKLNAGKQPQDGRFTINMGEESVDVRVSVLPTAFGESIVMRLLKASSIGLTFESLGLKGKAYNDLKSEMEKPNGMIISTGPTGSGKTTSLYAILNSLNDPETKIITLEDPIEYKLAGIVQSQVESADEISKNSSGGAGSKKNPYTFARGLRAILRQDPDVVMVGEIRDLETATTAINAALTGHLMLSTLHTNSAAGSIPRLLSMGIEPFLLAPSLNAIIGQRLVRKLCVNCKLEDTEIDNESMTIIMNALDTISPESGYKVDNLADLKFYKSTGCEKCHGLGYKGRVGIFEIFTMSPEIEKMISMGNVSEYEIEQVAIKNGMISMLQDGLLKALNGETSIEEIFDKVRD